MGTYDEMDASEIEATEACSAMPVLFYCFSADAAYIAALDAAGTCQEAPNV